MGSFILYKMSAQSNWYNDKYDDSDGEDDMAPARGRGAQSDNPKGAASRATRRSPARSSPKLPQKAVTQIPEDSSSEFLHSLRKTGSGQLEDIMTTLEVYKMKLEKMEKERMMLVEEADLATKRAADLEVALAEERRRRKEEKAIRIEAEEEIKRAQDERDKLEFELSVIVDEIGLVHHAMED